MTYDLSAHRDTMGRSPFAAYWSGDVATLPTAILHDRIEALGSFIGCLSTGYDSATQTWKRVEPEAAMLTKAIGLRVAALNEMEPRLEQARANA